MPILRMNPEVGYTKLSNLHVHQSKTLSFGARGLLGYLLSHGNGYRFYKGQLANNSNGEGREAINSLIKELEDHGHLKIEKTLDAGKFDGYEWEISELPILGNLNRKRETVAGEPSPETRQLQIKEKENGYTKEFERFWELGKKQGSKFDAAKKFEVALRLTDYDTLCRRIQESIAACAKIGRLHRDLSAWLHQRGWDDDYEAMAVAWKAKKTSAVPPKTASSASNHSQPLIVQQIKEYGTPEQRKEFFDNMADYMQYYRNALPNIHDMLAKLDTKIFSQNKESEAAQRSSP